MFRVEADLKKCEGYANCVLAAPEVFDLGSDGKVVVLNPECDESLRPQVAEAVRNCPTGALSMFDQ